MISTFSRVRHSSRICAPVMSFALLADIPLPPNNTKATVEGFAPPPSGQDSLKSGRSGGAGYTDPNNQNEPNYDDSCKESSGAGAEGLVGFRARHHGLFTSRITQQAEQMQGGMGITNSYANMIWVRPLWLDLGLI